MKKNISSKTISLIFSVMVICFLMAFYAFAWTEPTAAPPGGNVASPVNTSSDPQYKTGALRLGGLTVDFDSYLAKDGGSLLLQKN